MSPNTATPSSQAPIRAPRRPRQGLFSRRKIEQLKNALGLNTEEHWADSTYGNYMTTTLAARAVNPTIATGTGSSNRVGTSVRITSYSVKILASGATVGGLVRFIGVRNTDASAIAAASIVTTTNDLSTMLNHQLANYGGDLLFDETLPVGVDSAGGSAAVFERTIRRNDWHMTWPDGDTAGTPGALLEGGVTVYGFHSTGCTALITLTQRVTFVDN